MLKVNSAACDVPFTASSTRAGLPRSTATSSSAVYWTQSPVARLPGCVTMTEFSQRSLRAHYSHSNTRRPHQLLYDRFPAVYPRWTDTAADESHGGTPERLTTRTRVPTLCWC